MLPRFFKIKQPGYCLFLISVILLHGCSWVTEKAEEEGTLFPAKGKEIIDYHVHIAGLGYGDSGCFVNTLMRENYRFSFYLRALDVTEEDLRNFGDQIVVERLSTNVKRSKTISKAVILALDGVVDTRGRLDRERTQIYIPNDYAFRQAGHYENLLFAASINPYRIDALSRLKEVAGQGAVFIKWIPSIMYIDPSDPKLIPFYRQMVSLELPLLTHTGQERSFPDARDDLADPLKLELPLRLGVKVIAAHIATTGESEGQDNFERILPLFDKYPNLFADISSLTQINKFGFMEKALAIEGFEKRLIYGTDWPLQFFPLVSAWYHIDEISLFQAAAISGLDNVFDRDVALKYAMGMKKSVFYNGAGILQSTRQSTAGNANR